MIFFALYITVFLRVRMVEFLFFLLMMKLDYWAVLGGGLFTLRFIIWTCWVMLLFLLYDLELGVVKVVDLMLTA